MVHETLAGRDVIRMQDFSASEITTLLDIATRLKRERHAGRRHLDVLAGHTLFMIFFNPSLRTRNTFEAGIHQLGGHAHFLEPGAIRLPVLRSHEERPYATERISDIARVLSPIGEAIAIRILGDRVGWQYREGLSVIEEFARFSDIPVINMEDNIHHPCQGLADLMTLHELFDGDLRGRKIAVAWVYSPSVAKPVAPHHAFMYAASLCGVDMVFARPPEMRIDPDIERAVENNLRERGGSFTVVEDLDEACEQADVVYAKNYVCLDLLPPHIPASASEQMHKLFSRYRSWIIDERRMRLAKPNARYMHCLPCDRGFEVTDTVLDGPWGERVFRQAENRLHVQKSIMTCILSSSVKRDSEYQESNS